MEEKNQLPKQIISQLENFNEGQLRQLNHIIVERIKLLNQEKAFHALSKFNIGDIVSFNHYGEIIIGRIIRINQKTASILTLDQKHRWNVSPALLKKEDEDHAEESKNIEPQLEFFSSEYDNANYNNNSELQVINPNKNVSRNAPCPCGSEKKYKNCCLK